jgi:hypothetical protein
LVGIVLTGTRITMPTKGRGAQGNWIIRPEEGDRVVAVARVKAEPVVPDAPAA